MNIIMQRVEQICSASRDNYPESYRSWPQDSIPDLL